MLQLFYISNWDLDKVGEGVENRSRARIPESECLVPDGSLSLTSCVTLGKLLRASDPYL